MKCAYLPVVAAIGSLLLDLGVSFAAPPPPGQPPGSTPATSPALTGVEGWKAAADPPAETKWHFRSDLKVQAPIKNHLMMAVSERPSPFVGLGNDDFGQQAWALLDVRTGAMTAGPRGKLGLEATAISPDGEYLVGRSFAKGRDQATLDLYSFKTKKLVQRISNVDPSITVGGFIDGNRLVALVSKGFKKTLQVWEIGSGNKVADVPIEKVERSQFAVSPGGKFFATVTEENLVIYAADATAAATVPIPASSETLFSTSRAIPKYLVFSEDGKEVAALCDVESRREDRRMIVWDMPSGQVIRDLILPRTPEEMGDRPLRFECLPDGSGWRFERSILDLQTGKKLWDIPPSSPGKKDVFIRVLDADNVLEISDQDFGKGIAISTARIPHDDLAKAAEAVRAGGTALDSRLGRLTTADWSADKEASVANESSWSPILSGVPPKDSGSSAVASSIPLQVKGSNLVPRHVVFSGSKGNAAAVTFTEGFESERTPRSVIQKIDLGGRQSETILDVPGSAEALDISADGKLTLIRTGTDRVDLYSTAASPKPFCGFRPYEKMPAEQSTEPNFFFRAPTDVVWGGILDDTHILTMGGSGKVVCWEVPGCRAQWSFSAKKTSPCLDPGRKILALESDKFLHLFDARTGQLRAALPVRGGFGGSAALAFRPDGAQLLRTVKRAALDLTVWDLTDGKVVNETSVSGLNFADPRSTWCGNSHVLVNRTDLVSLDLHTTVWRYTRDGFNESPMTSVGNLLWGVCAGKTGDSWSLAGFNVPQQEVKALEASVNPDTQVLIRPGTKISVQVSLVGDAQNQKAVVDGMNSQLTAAGFVPADGQPIQLVASVVQKGTQRVEYSPFGLPSNNSQTADVPDYLCKLSFLANGQTVWSSEAAAGGAYPRHLQLKQGQTIQQFIDEINANPGRFFFMQTELPRLIGRPIGDLRVSKFTSSGLASGDTNERPQIGGTGIGGAGHRR